MPHATLRCLSADEVRRALPMTEAVEAMKRALAALSAGEAAVPPRTHLALGGPSPDADDAANPAGTALVMPAYAPADGRMGVKIVTLLKGNPGRGLPLLQGLMVLVDATTGAPIAVMDAASLTAVRTGAASGAATDLLARPDAQAAAVFGAGVQGRTQLEAVCAVRPIRQARVFDVHPEAARALADEMTGRLGIAVDPAASPAEALAGADVVCTATTASEPVFDDADLAAGVHLNAVGAYQPPAREVPAETVCRARVVVDQRAAALEEAGDLVVPIRDGLITADHIAAEVGEIVAGRAEGRQSAEQVTLFKSVGVAVEDVAAAAAALVGAERLGLGTVVRL